MSERGGRKGPRADASGSDNKRFGRMGRTREIEAGKAESPPLC